MRKSHRAGIVAVVAIVLFVADVWAFRAGDGVEAQENPPAGRKVAFLVGINKYLKPGLPNLQYAEPDVDAIAAQLMMFGFDVTVLKGSSKGSAQATRENIEKTVRRLAAPLSKNDMMLVMLSGHGQQLVIVQPDGRRKDEAFYCPVDAVAGDAATLFSLSHLVDDILAPKVARKMLLVDACRDSPSDPARGSRGIQGRVISLPEDTAVFFSCRSGQESFERDELKHGLFTYCILEGLRGKAAQDNEIDWSGLVSHVSRRMGQPDMRRLMPADRPQVPIPAGGIPYTVLARITTSPPEPEKPPAAPDLLDSPFDEKQAVAKRRAWAQYQQLDEERKNSLDMQLVLIPAGSFTMGSPEAVDQLVKAFSAAEKKWLTGERPVHPVTISQPFYLGKYEVTKGQFAKFVDDTNYKTDAEKDGKGAYGFTGDKDKPFVQKPSFTWRDWGVDQGNNSPVVNVSHNDAVAFCDWLSKSEGKKYRLPTEAEWEYACRAGTTSRYYNGDDPEGLIQIGNTRDVSLKKQIKLPDNNTIDSDDGWPFTSPVGRFRPNNFGLYDMIGNAVEWCAVRYGEDFYSNSPQRDPTGPDSGSFWVARGGGWSTNAVDCRAAFRDRYLADDRYFHLGFRLACSSRE